MTARAPYRPGSEGRPIGMHLALALLLVALLASGCSMASSTLMDTSRHMSCTHDGGTYYLSRSVIKLAVHEIKDPDGLTETGGFVMEHVTAEVDQERRLAYCLDFLKSPTSDDVLIVSRNEQMLLTKISSTADDKSKEIAQSLIKAIFVGLSKDPQFGTATARSGGLAPRIGSTKVFETTYDPFDADQTALVNKALHQFGFCILVENKRFLASDRPVDAQCDHPLKGGGRMEQRIIDASVDKSFDHPAPFTQGVFYRPRLPYNVMVFVKKNRQVAGGWQLRGSSTALFENDSPVFSIGVDRTFFAKRSTTLDFDSGVLQNARIVKGSELLGFVQIPLQIAQSVAALPTSILQIRIDDTNNRHKLIAAQQQLLQSHLNYLASLEKYKAIDNRSPIKSIDIGVADGLPVDPLRSVGGLPDAAGWNASVQTAAAGVSYNHCQVDCAKDPANAPYCPRYCQCRATQCTASGDSASCQNFCAGLLKPTN